MEPRIVIEVSPDGIREILVRNERKDLKQATALVARIGPALLALDALWDQPAAPGDNQERRVVDRQAGSPA